MSAALSPPFMLAALVLCVAGVAKLRSPSGAVRAAALAGLPARRSLVRLLAACELGLGGWGLASPGRVGAVGMALLYASFTAVTILLARRRASCGCFGEAEAPASWLQAMLSAGLAAIAAAAAVQVPNGIGWVLGRPAAQVIVLALGVAGAAYGAVLAYTQVPHAWTSWSGR